MAQPSSLGNRIRHISDSLATRRIIFLAGYGCCKDIFVPTHAIEVRGKKSYTSRVFNILLCGHGVNPLTYTTITGLAIARRSNLESLKDLVSNACDARKQARGT